MKDPNKNEGARVATTNIDFSHCQGQITLQSRVDLAEIRTHPRCYGYPCYFQV